MNWQDWAALAIAFIAAWSLVAPWIKRWRSPGTPVVGCGSKCSGCPASATKPATSDPISQIAPGPSELLTIAPLMVMAPRNRPHPRALERDRKSATG